MAQHPDAEVIAHPECHEGILRHAELHRVDERPHRLREEVAEAGVHRRDRGRHPAQDGAGRAGQDADRGAARGRELLVQRVPVHEAEHAREALPVRCAICSRRSMCPSRCACARCRPIQRMLEMSAVKLARCSSRWLRARTAIRPRSRHPSRRRSSPTHGLDAGQHGPRHGASPTTGSSTKVTLPALAAAGREVDCGGATVSHGTGVIGHAGLAWGDGVHGSGARGHDGPMKREGDGKVACRCVPREQRVRLRARATKPCFRYATSALDDTTECVDDPEVGRLQHDRRAHGSADWTSAEHMRRDDDLYSIGVDCRAQPGPRAGRRQLHLPARVERPRVDDRRVHRDGRDTLASCSSDSPGTLVFVLLPRAEYRALAAIHGACPRSRLRSMIWKTILVPHDFSSSANHAAAIARDEAKLHGATIVLLHVIDFAARRSSPTP